MKTTIDLPEDLLHRAKITAAERKTTLKELVLRGLTHSIENPEQSQKETKKTRQKRLLGLLEQNNSTPVNPLTREEIYEDA